MYVVCVWCVVCMWVYDVCMCVMCGVCVVCVYDVCVDVCGVGCVWGVWYVRVCDFPSCQHVGEKTSLLVRAQSLVKSSGEKNNRR